MADITYRSARRAKATATRRESCAELATPDKSTAVFVKLLADGNIVLSIHRNGQEYRRELSPEMRYDD